jgi:hypothetical protein
VLKKAGLEGQEVVFLFNDTQILHEGFLEDLNNILNAGELKSARTARGTRHYMCTAAVLHCMSTGLVNQAST